MELLINGIDYSKYAKRPYYIETTLDESLNQSHFILANTKRDTPFKPFSKAYIDDTLWYVDSDTCTEIIGKDLYDHDLLFVEESKLLERIVCPAKTFTNALIKKAPDHQSPAPFYYGAATTITIPSSGIPPILDYGDIGRAGLSKTPNIGKSKTINSPASEIPNFDPVAVQDYTWKVKIVNHLTGGVEAETSIANYNVSFDYSFQDYSDYYIIYIGSFGNEIYGYFLNVAVMADTETKEDYTIGTVVQELLETASCIRTNETPRINITDAEFNNLDAFTSPDFSFSNGSTLWENLLEVGGYIHAIPRLKDGYIYFDALGGIEQSTITGRMLSKSISYSAEQYCNKIDTIAENLVNMDVSGEGSISEPLDYSTSYRSLRTEDQVRINEDNGMIPTSYPIERIEKITVADGESVDNIDITDYLMTKREYSLLSKQSGIFPYSATHAIYYDYNTKNIYGLFYKADDNIISSVFNKYAIVNIINDMMGTDDYSIGNYANLMFRITYVPIIEARVRQVKNENILTPDNKDLTMVYNQSATKLSSTQLGKNLKGTIAMLATSDERKTTYIYPATTELEDLPKVGELVGDTDYINKVTAEFNGTCVKATISLTTNYNQYGKFVSVDRDRREFEISDQNVYNRQVLYENHIVVSENNGVTSSDNSIITDLAFGEISSKYFEQNAYTKECSYAKVTTYNSSMEALKTVLLPVISVGMGNSAVFSFSFEDNYSAGAVSVPSLNEDALYRELQYVPYSDLFGCAKYMGVNFYQTAGLSIAALGSYETNRAVAHSLPLDSDYVLGSGLIFSTGSYPIILNKDSRERIIFTYQLHFCSDSGIIISDKLASKIAFTKTQFYETTSNARIYYMNKRIHPISGIETASSIVDNTQIYWDSTNQRAYTPTRNNSSTFQSWAVFRDGTFLYGKNSTTKPDYIYFKKGRSKVTE